MSELKNDPSAPADPEPNYNLLKWVFSISELTAGLRRYSGDPTLTVNSISEREITQRLPAVGHLRGLSVATNGTNGPQTYDLVLKETHGSTRTGAAGAGLREISVYMTLKEHLPVRLPTLITAHPKGEWMLLVHLPPGRRPDKWQAADYLLAADQLAILHDRFWGLEDILATYAWLENPLKSDRDIYTQAATQNAEKLAKSKSPLLAEHHHIIDMTEQIIPQLDTVIERLHTSPFTLLHGDYWPGNIHIHPTNGLTVFDWEDAAIGPPVLDLLSFVQASGWHFSPLPLSGEEIIQHYLNRLEIEGERKISEKEFELQWDCAVIWTFINGWLATLANLPDSILSLRLEALQHMLFQPLQEAVQRQLT